MRATAVVVLAGVGGFVALGGTALARATTGYARFEVNGSSVVQWDEVKNGFAMDIIVGTDDPLGMVGFTLWLDGDPGFGYAAVTAANYNSGLNWDASWGGYPSAGHLPMSEVASGVYLGAPCMFDGDTPVWAQNGRAMTVSFTTVPPPGTYVIGSITEPYHRRLSIGDSDYVDLVLGDPRLTFTPLTILVPEPAALLLLAVSGLAMVRRRLG